MTPSICIAERTISANHPPYIIAELSANHNGCFEDALKMIDAAKMAGADAVKLQTYRPDTITLDHDSAEFRIDSGLWKGQTLYQLYQGAHMPWEWHQPLFEHAHKLGITLFSSPFDTTAVDLLESLNAPAYKIASFEAIDLPLIRYVAATKKPMIISTGMATAEEIEEAIDTAMAAGCKQLAILHCVSGYPAQPKDYHLNTIPDMIRRFGCITGLSDHTLDITTAITSVALGSRIIEKHVTLDRSRGGPDDSFSLEPAELALLCKAAKTAWQALGEVNYRLKEGENENVRFRRSLYFVQSVKQGEVITHNHVKSIRPGYGAHPRMLDQIIGQKSPADFKRGTAVPKSFLTIQQK